MQYKEIMPYAVHPTNTSERIVLKMANGQKLVGFFDNNPYSKDEVNQWGFVETKDNRTYPF